LAKAERTPCKDETCPVSTGGRTRRVQLVQGEGGAHALQEVCVEVGPEALADVPCGGEREREMSVRSGGLHVRCQLSHRHKAMLVWSGDA
jgi:hypothetical protein